MANGLVSNLPQLNRNFRTFHFARTDFDSVKDLLLFLFRLFHILTSRDGSIYGFSLSSLPVYLRSEFKILVKLTRFSTRVNCGLIVLLPFDEAIASRAVFVIVSGPDGRAVPL